MTAKSTRTLLLLALAPLCASILSGAAPLTDSSDSAAMDSGPWEIASGPWEGPTSGPWESADSADSGPWE